jgi:uncharacterized protein YdiU (UPF0061 family)
MTDVTAIAFPFNNRFAALPAQLYSETTPTAVREPKLIKFNSALATELGLDSNALNTPAGAAIFAGNALPDTAKPLAMAYAGHQFGNWVPQLGDGRAVLLGDLLDTHQRYREIQLKGAGITPYSRNGDGRAWLGPILREYVVSEAMAAMGVPTTRALAAVLTGEPVYREDAMPGAIITRVAHSHIRVGTFQYFIARGDLTAIDALIDHIIDTCYPDLAQADNKALALFNAVIQRQAQLIAHWQSIGFIHGVMNTDNMTLSGETIDYGPCAFLDEYNPKKVFSSIDRMGRYSYINQPAAAHWNLSNFAQALLPFINKDQDSALEAAQEALDGFPTLYKAEYEKRMQAKIGIEKSTDDATQLVTELLDLMVEAQSDFTLTFTYLSGVLSGEENGTTLDIKEYYKAPSALQAWMEKWSRYLSEQKTSKQQQLELMRMSNPQLIPRNHRIEECIQAALEDDYAPFNTLIDALRQPFSPDKKYAYLAAAPSASEAVAHTFCGT